MKQFALRFTPHLLAVVLFFYCWNVYWGQNRWRSFFLADSNGYYAYLPATFIYHDFTFSFIEPVQKKYFSTHDNFDIRSSYNGHTLDKWYCGTALSITPFFLAGHAIALVTNSEADGYTFWYAFSISIAAVFYCFIGLIVLQKILKNFFANEALVSLLLALALFATNLFYYTTGEPLMSHVYSFAFINLFVLAIINFIKRPNNKSIVLAALYLGVIVLIRPINGIIIFIMPFLAGSKSAFKNFLAGILKARKAILPGLLIFLSLLCLQLFFYKMETGSFFIYSYANETMNILQPHLIDFLFSYKKGLFLYLPLLFLSLTGFIFLFKKNRWQFNSLAIFVFGLWYLFSSWWNWWYGGSFGTRPLIEFLFVFVILLGYTLSILKGIKKKVFISLCFLCLLVCQVQTYQYRYYFIHWDRMTKERYWNVFMRLDLVAKKENPNADLLQ